jgi:hypothetical protein
VPSPLCLHDKPNYALHSHWNTFCILCSCQNLNTYGLYFIKVHMACCVWLSVGYGLHSLWNAPSFLSSN